MESVTREELVKMVESLRKQLKVCDIHLFKAGIGNIVVENAAVLHGSYMLLKRVEQEGCHHYYRWVCGLHNGDSQFECVHCGNKVISKGMPE